MKTKTGINKPGIPTKIKPHLQGKDLDVGIDVRIEGTLELEPVGDGCVNHIRMTIDSGIPFVGKTLAEFVARDCERIIAEEYEYLCERLDSAASHP